MNKLVFLLLGLTSSLLSFTGCSTSSSNAGSTQRVFPYDMPEKKPDHPLSAAVERNYDAYMGIRPETNELYTQFKYTALKGFDYHDGDGTISRRDPSKVIFANGKYYIWYTYRNTPTPPQGPEKCNDTIPSTDWDLADIWYATSDDGFTWQEQGVAVPRPPKPYIGWRSVTTADILEWKGTYYLYYQAFSKASGKNGGDDCPVAISYADSPDGPWTAYNKAVIQNGAPGEWDQYSIHDPYPLIHDGKVYLYYKSDFGRSPATNIVRMQGLAIADNPMGPFKKHPLNPLVNSGHETTLFPFKEGVAAFVIRDGNEHNTIQYAKDWVNFKIASMVELMPDAAGPFVPDAFTDTQDGRGITWGISHYGRPHGDWKRNYFVLLRFDCDLCLDLNDQQMKRHHSTPKFNYLLEHGLNKKQKERAQKETEILKAKSQ